MSWKKQRPWSIAQEYLRSDGRPGHIPPIRKFCLWMHHNGLELDELDQAHVELFWKEHKSTLRASTIDHYRVSLHKWHYWMALRRLISFEVQTPLKRHLDEPLPKVAKRFLAANPDKHIERRIRYFHTWLRREKLTLRRLTARHFKDFASCPRGVPNKKGAAEAILRHLEPYFFWLYDERFIRFRVERLPPRVERLPRNAVAFVKALKTTRKTSTCQSYASSIQGFYIWLEDNGISMAKLRRRDMVRWLTFLCENGISRGARRNRINHLRTYFEWLFQNELIPFDPCGLLHSADVPKLPLYLPRPYPPEVDAQLQRRLEKINSTHSNALLLMRLTGVRIGELVNLEPKCVWADYDGYFFLKVPLGKLDNERLVPLNSRCIQLIENLNKQCLPTDPFLLESNRSRISVKSALNKALKNAAIDLDTAGPAVSHRLRHTYATELLNAGMSLVSIMKLLGHKAIAMTSRYSAITQQSVLEEYGVAIAKISKKIDLKSPDPSTDDADPGRLLLGAVSALRKNAGVLGIDDKKLAALINRIRRIECDINVLRQHQKQALMGPHTTTIWAG